MGTKFTQLKTDLSQNNWLVFVVFLMYKLSSFFRRVVSFRWAAKKLSDFFFYFGFYMCFSPLSGLEKSTSPTPGASENFCLASE